MHTPCVEACRLMRLERRLPGWWAGRGIICRQVEVQVWNCVVYCPKAAAPICSGQSSLDP